MANDLIAVRTGELDRAKSEARSVRRKRDSSTWGCKQLDVNTSQLVSKIRFS
jgi:hypothetical protein